MVSVQVSPIAGSEGTVKTVKKRRKLKSQKILSPINTNIQSLGTQVPDTVQKQGGGLEPCQEPTVLVCEVPNLPNLAESVTAGTPKNKSFSGKVDGSTVPDLETRLRQDLDTYNRVLNRDQKIKNDFISGTVGAPVPYSQYLKNLKVNQSTKFSEKSKKSVTQTEKVWQNLANLVKLKDWNFQLSSEQSNAVFYWAILILYTIMCVLFDFTPLAFAYALASMYSALVFKDKLPNVLESYTRLRDGFWNVFAGEFGLPKIIPSVLKMSLAEAKQKREQFAEQDEHFDKDKKSSGVINLESKVSGDTVTHYNFKVKCQINDLDEVIAEIDSDSHISLISTEYFDRLNDMDEIDYLSEPPPVFNGLGSVVYSRYSPISLNVQIGRVRMKNRFVVTDLLKSSPLLLGTDFIVKNNVSFAPHSEGQWYVTIGTMDNILGKVPALVTNKINLVSAKLENFRPLEVKKISVTANLNYFQKELFVENGVLNTLKKYDLSHSPFEILEDKLGIKGTVLVRNNAPVDTILPSGMELATTELDLTSYSVRSCPEEEVKNVSLNSTEKLSRR